LRDQRVNQRYLPGVALPASLAVGVWPAPGAVDTASQLATASLLADQELIVIATPMAALRESLGRLGNCSAPVAWLCKGFEEAQADAAAQGSGPHGLLAHEVLQQTAPGLHAGVLSGPSFALEVARGQPTALVAASVAASVRAALAGAFRSPSLRIYTSDDIVGVEVGGAVKNVLAIATGLCDGLRLGLNARAALITRGLHEMTRLGVALGARAETFMGLSGLGDLVLTATGDLSRNRKVVKEEFKVVVRVWLGDDGKVQKADIITGSGNPKVDDLIQLTLLDMTPLKDIPPSSMRPMQLRLSNRS